MASRQAHVDYLLDQMALAGAVSARKMFGEYGLYCGGVLVAMVCDDQLFIKPTEAGRAHAGGLPEGPPYPGAKPCIMVPGERWEDGEWLATLVRLTAAGLPPAKPKARRG